MLPFDPLQQTRRHFFSRAAQGLGAIALAGMGGDRLFADSNTASSGAGALPGLPHFPARAKRVIYLFQSGAPSQIDLFDPKPVLAQRNGEQLPESIRGKQRLTGMSAQQASLPLAGSHFKFEPRGKCGMQISELLPYTSRVADEICLIRSMYTEAINHDPAITFFQTGSQIAGRPSMGSWVSYGLGSTNENLPSFIVLVTAGQGDQPLYSRLWGSGFLDSRYQGVQFRSGREPILYLTNPEGIAAESRRSMLDKLNALNRAQFEKELDPEIESRIAQYEMAFRMQTSVPDATDLSKEPASIFELYGEDSRKPGTFAANCLLARRFAERGVRFIQLYHQGWDQHDNLPSGIRSQAKKTDQASAALVQDLKDRGLLDDTLVIWGGEFGRTAYSQGKLTRENYGRDHHPRCFSIWMAGAGIRKGFSYGETDDYSYNVVTNPVHVHDLQTTILQQLGIDHERLTYMYQGRRFRLTDIHGNLIKDVLA